MIRLVVFFNATKENRMNNNLMMIDSSNVLTMSSLEIAELTGKQHKDVIRDIRNMLNQLEINSAQFCAQYKDSIGRSLPMFNLPKDETLCLIAGYNVQVRMRIIKRWQELEAKGKPDLSTDVGKLLLIQEMAAKQLELISENKRISESLSIAAPKAEFVDSFVDSTGLKSFRKVAKILGINERKFRQFLVDNKIMYKQNNDWLPYAEHINAGRFVNKTGESQGHAFISTYFTPKGEVWIAALLKDEVEIA